MNVIHIKGARTAPRGKRSKMETILITPATIKSWLHPPFQRPKKINEKVRQVSEEIKAEGGIIPGVITLGELAGETAPRRIWLLDGQHRGEAALMTGLDEFIADVRIYTAEDMADMGEEFVRLNSSLVRMQPDDVLRGLEESVSALKKIRRDCPFVGYDQIRRGTNAPILSMGAALRCWWKSSQETPAAHTISVTQYVNDLTDDECEQLIRFLVIARAAWGPDAAYARLWGALNLTMCMWLYRRLVMDRERRGRSRHVVLGVDAFKKCLMSVSANGDYLDWLVGRGMNDRDRSPAYVRIKQAFETRLRQDGISDSSYRSALPKPAWSAR